MDAEGRVHGAERLSVLDASIMPDVPSGFTHFPTIMLIAERLSESLVAFVKFGHSRSRSGPLPGHSRGTESRNQEDLGGPGRTRSRQQSNTSRHLRSREDTGGHVTNTVRDREAPGSNPGPPTKVALIELTARNAGEGLFKSYAAQVATLDFDFG